MNVLVTGAGGFIGRHVVRKARLHSWKVIGVARRPCAEATLVADLCQPIGNWEAPDVVIHLAGSYAGCGAREFSNVDIAIARYLIAWGKQKGVRRWVFASAAEVYGDIRGTADESYPCRPVIPYGRAKLEIEGMFRSAGFPELMICRIGEVYGPEGRIMYELGGKLRSGFCPWSGNGNVTISFVHVDDAAEALILACTQAKSGVNLFNIGDDGPATWRQFLNEIAGFFGVRSAFFLPKPAAYCYAVGVSWFDQLLHRPPNVTPYVLRLLTTPKVLSSARAREELDFVPQYANIQSGLQAVLHDMSLPR